MPKGIKLSEFEKGQVIALDKEGFSHRDIAKKLGRSRAPINNFLRNPETYNAAHAGGRPKFPSPRDERLILRELKKNRRTSLKQIKSKTNVTASVSTIKRMLQKKNISRKKMKSQSKLSIDHNRRRLQFPVTIRLGMKSDPQSSSMLKINGTWMDLMPINITVLLYYWADSSTVIFIAIRSIQVQFIFIAEEDCGPLFIPCLMVMGKLQAPALVINGEF